MTPRSEMHSAAFVFGSEGVINNTVGWNTGIAFLFGLLSVQWTVSQSRILDVRPVWKSSLDDCKRQFNVSKRPVLTTITGI